MQTTLPTRIGIVADDLTSATDGAAPFLGKGCPPLIIRSNGVLKTKHAVVSIDTNSRALTPSAAANETAAATAALADRTLLFKTIDSTLRGHIRAEILAAFRVSGRTRLVVAPAFPDAGRTTINGVQMVDGIPVSESAYGRDPVHAASTSIIGEVIDPSLGRPVIVAQADAGAAAGALRDRVLIIDTNSQTALNHCISCIPEPENVLWVGSPGLAIALAASLPDASHISPAARATGKRVLIVAGSANPVTLGQCKALREQGVSVVTELSAASSDAAILCLRAPAARQSDARAILTALSSQAAQLLSRQDFDVLIATGGETMAAILDQLDLRRFFLEAELAPGFPVARAELVDGRPIVIAMKAGGFGSEVALLSAARSLQHGRTVEARLS